jgi:hypothetical protein
MARPNKIRLGEILVQQRLLTDEQLKLVKHVYSLGNLL